MTTINVSEDGYLKKVRRKNGVISFPTQNPITINPLMINTLFDFEHISLPVAPMPDRISKNMMVKISYNIRQPTAHWTYSVLSVF
jgi:hypothetical protein